jgi:acyl carrier protein
VEKLLSILAESLKTDASQLSKETRPQDIENWDSLAQLLLVQNIEEAYGLTLDMKEILGIRNVGDICRVLERRGVRLE